MIGKMVKEVRNIQAHLFWMAFAMGILVGLALASAVVAWANVVIWLGGR